ncbi:division/cell wall cluster transcriptional repressor MraZ [Fodinicurvata sediminis]|uniref:division/cell wall cluster transcriptional repressor MraZ n=1 Tax=Fodinicurvata sediminis TaxID=1121832 RepID=UPI0003B3BD23|nr:cell division protein MraZ [Fodinicurvata sediminis]
MQAQTPFLGTFRNRVDRKGRVSVPAPFRQVLAGESFQGVVCFLSHKVEAIEGCGMGFMSELSESVADMDLFSDNHQDLASSLFADAHPLAWDSGGRIQLPPELMEVAGITEEAAFVGMGKTFRIWEPQAFSSYQGERRAQARQKGLSLPLRRAKEE